MQIHQLKRDHKNYKAPRVGRGGKRGKTSGRGTKGQLARSGHKLRPELRDIIKKIPKLRGRGRNFLKSINLESVPVNLKTLEAHFENGAVVSPVVLREKGIIRMKKGEPRSVKILGVGEITKKLTIENCFISASAKEKIEKAGGSITE